MLVRIVVLNLACMTEEQITFAIFDLDMRLTRKWLQRTHLCCWPSPCPCHNPGPSWKTAQSGEKSVGSYDYPTEESEVAE